MNIWGHLSPGLTSGAAPQRVETGPAVVCVILTAHPSSLVSTEDLTGPDALVSK